MTLRPPCAVVVPSTVPRRSHTSPICAHFRPTGHQGRALLHPPSRLIYGQHWRSRRVLSPAGTTRGHRRKSLNPARGGPAAQRAGPVVAASQRAGGERPDRGRVVGRNTATDGGEGAAELRSPAASLAG